MERVTFRLPEEQVEAIEDMVDNGEFPSVSEAMRTFAREGLDKRGESYDPPPVFER